MSLLKQVQFCTLIVAVFLIAGCDAIFPNEQLAEIRIADVASGEDVSSAIVTIAPEYRERIAWADLTDDEYLDLDRLQNDSKTTGDDGEAVLALYSLTICGWPIICDPLRDQVTGELYLIRIETDGASEILTVEMSVDNSVSGESFTVTVVSIGQPMLVPWE